MCVLPAPQPDEWMRDVAREMNLSETAFLVPQNGGYNPTGTIGALTYWAADAIRNRYLRNPGPLA